MHLPLAKCMLIYAQNNALQNCMLPEQAKMSRIFTKHTEVSHVESAYFICIQKQKKSMYASMSDNIILQAL